MAIEKMTLVCIEGALRKVNRTVLKCCESNCFHIVPSTHDGAGSASRFKTLKDKNVYAPLVKRAYAISETLDIKPEFVDYEDLEHMNVSVDFSQYLKELETVTEKLSADRDELKSSLEQHSQVLMQIEQLAGLSSDFSELFAMKYVRVRFGKLPVDSEPKLKYYEDRDFLFFPFGKDDDYVWGIYFTPRTQRAIVDDIFKSLYFERIRIPDYIKGSADEAKTAVIKLIKEEQEKLDVINAQLKSFSEGARAKFLKVFCKLKTLSDSAEMRGNVSVINGTFILEGFVPEKETKRFKKLLGEIEDVKIVEKPRESEPMLTTPVKLKNCWLFRPFEMFVKMYGLPDYNGIDPTPFVAITYMLIFGIMFGDLGQGLVISALGTLLWHWKKAKLGAVMSRIGISSAVFGTLYGSVFGNEELITPFFKIEPIYKAMGFTTAPENIFQISSYLLIAALGIGVILIIISMTMNIMLSFKNGDLKTALLSPSGLTGAIFYIAVIAGAGLQLGFGIEMFSTPYVLGLIILPLCIFFFSEPIGALLDVLKRRANGNKINKNSALVHSVKSYSDAIARLSSVGGESDLDKLLESKFILTRFGRLKYENYLKLEAEEDGKFLFFPFENDDEYVSGVYFAPQSEAPAVERIFASLGFETMKMPEHIKDITKETAQYLKKNGISTPEKAEKKSVGTFIIEGIIEVFESCLTYVTNTMSFLRIGGFILSHAGMMLVFAVLSETVGGGVGGIILTVFGNLFVIGMEGFLVGIQVLRLEFYEMFSRFYKGSGKPFTPIGLDLSFNK